MIWIEAVFTFTNEVLNVSRSTLAVCVLFFVSLSAMPAHAADPPLFFNPLKGFTRSPLTAEAEVYSGAITGKDIGSAYHSVTRGNYGLRFTFGFLKALNFNLSYLYSNQTRSLRAVTPPVGTLPSGFAFLRAANLNMAYGSGELNVLRSGSATFYVSPGVGLVRNGARSMTIVTPVGTASSPGFPGTAVTFNLGAGVKFYPLKHWGIRLDVRDHISGGGTGNLNPRGNLTIAGNSIANPQQFFGDVPVNNNLVFTLGLIFRIL